MVCTGCGRLEFFVAEPEAWFQAMTARGHVSNLSAPFPMLVGPDALK